MFSDFLEHRAVRYRPIFDPGRYHGQTWSRQTRCESCDAIAIPVAHERSHQFAFADQREQFADAESRTLG